MGKALLGQTKSNPHRLVAALTINPQQKHFLCYKSSGEAVQTAVADVPLAGLDARMSRPPVPDAADARIP